MLKKTPDKPLFVQRYALVFLYVGIGIMVISFSAMSLVPVERVYAAASGVGLGAVIASGWLLYGDSL